MTLLTARRPHIIDVSYLQNAAKVIANPPLESGVKADVNAESAASKPLNLSKPTRQALIQLVFDEYFRRRGLNFRDPVRTVSKRG